MFLHDPEELQSLYREGLEISEAKVAPRHRIVEGERRGVEERRSINTTIKNIDCSSDETQ